MTITMSDSPTSLGSVYRAHRPLMLFSAAMAVLLAVSLVGLAVDDRLLVGAPVWLKPMKFAISLLLYTLTLAWMVSLLRRWRRLAWWGGTVFVVGMSVEMAWITASAATARMSHFNETTPTATTIHEIMGATIATVWAANAVVAVALLIERLPDPADTSAVRSGAVLALVGAALGFLMFANPGAITADDIAGAHSVGVPDGGPSMPVTAWSTTGGDLRIPHFVGIHALQALPLLAWALTALGPRVRQLSDRRTKVGLVRVGTAAWTGLTALVTWQALRGQPLLQPDALTLAAAALLVVGTAVAATLVLRARTT